MHYRVGTRGSKLARVQTEYVIDTLKKAYPQDTFEMVIIKTTGDRNQVQALDAIGAKGIFTDEIEKQLLSGEIAMAVHSMKDMPDQPAEGLTFARAWKREDPRDVLILREAASLRELPKGAVIGTGSKRRAYQLKKIRPDLQIIGIRGNVDTRIRKLRAPGLDAEGKKEPLMDGIVLAAAGLRRLGRENEITCYLEPEEMIPAPAQGILAIETSAANHKLLEKIDALYDPKTERAAGLERGFLTAIGGDCHMPVGALYDPEGSFYALYGSEDGSQLAAVCVSCRDEEQKSTEEIIHEAVGKMRKAVEESGAHKDKK